MVCWSNSPVQLFPNDLMWFLVIKWGLKGAILSSCHGEQEGPLTPHLTNYTCVYLFITCSHLLPQPPCFRSLLPTVLDAALLSYWDVIFPWQWHRSKKQTQPYLSLKGILWLRPKTREHSALHGASVVKIEPYYRGRESCELWFNQPGGGCFISLHFFLIFADLDMEQGTGSKLGKE